MQSTTAIDTATLYETKATSSEARFWCAYLASGSWLVLVRLVVAYLYCFGGGISVVTQSGRI